MTRGLVPNLCLWPIGATYIDCNCSVGCWNVVNWAQYRGESVIKCDLIGDGSARVCVRSRVWSGYFRILGDAGYVVRSRMLTVGPSPNSLLRLI